jgi:hypothetical protein
VCAARRADVSSIESVVEARSMRVESKKIIFCRFRHAHDGELDGVYVSILADSRGGLCTVVMDSVDTNIENVAVRNGPGSLPDMPQTAGLKTQYVYMVPGMGGPGLRTYN